MTNRSPSRPKKGVQKSVPPGAIIEELRIRGFRAFADARLILDQTTVLIGRNGAGKSTIVDALEFIRDALADSLENALERRGGFSAIRRHPTDPKQPDIFLAIKLYLLDDTYDSLLLFSSQLVETVLYGFRLGMTRNGKGFAVKDEVLVTNGNIVHFDRNAHGESQPEKYPLFAPESLALPIIAAADPLARTVLSVLRNGIRTYRLSIDALRAEPRVGSSTFLLPNGENAGDVLAHLRNPADKDWILRHLRGVTPGITGIRATTAAGRRIIQFLQQGPNDTVQRFGVNDMSDGTLRCLGILLALRQPHVLTCIDEIEDSIHPAALSILVDAINATGRVLFTSHSPEVLSHPQITAEKIRVIEWRDGASNIFSLDPGVAEVARPPSSIGKLLRSNALWTTEAPIGNRGDILGLE